MIHNLDNSGRRRPANGLAAHSFSRRLPVMAFAVDQAGKLAATSDQFGELLGYTAGELAGSSVADLLSTAARQRFESAYLPLLLATGQLKEVECEFIQHDGTVTPLLLSASAEQDEAGALLGWQAVLAHPDQRTQAQRVLLEILEGTAALTGGDFFRSLVRHVARSFRVCYAMITECTDQTLTRVRTLACYKYENFLEQFEYNLAGGPCEAVIAGGVCHYPRLRDFFPKEDQDAYLGVPILGAQGNVLGHLVIEDDKEFQPGPYDIEILQLFAARAGAELERKRAEEALRKREHQLQQLNDRLADSNRTLEERVAGRTREIEQRRQVAESLRDMVLILNSQRPLDEILTYIVAAATGLLGTESGAIYTLQPDQQMLAIQTTRGMPADYTRERVLPVEQSFLEQAVQNGQPVVISNLAALLAAQSPPATSHSEVLLSNVFRTLLAVPLVGPDGGEVYGGIALYYPQERQFSDEEIALVATFAAQAALAIENARLRERAGLAAVMEERGRLARELHDSVTQQLYSLTLLAEGWRRMAQNGQLSGVEEALAELGQLGQQALKEMRLLVHELRPPALEQDGLLGALHQRLAAVERRAGVEARLVANDLCELPAALEAGVYRIAQEALNNALKHAEATTVTVALHCNADSFTLTISDNGQGFEPAAQQNGGGIGLASMGERARQLHGTLAVRSSPGQGTVVEVKIPL